MKHPRLVAEVLAYAEFNGVSAASEEYGISLTAIRTWSRPDGSFEPVEHGTQQAYNFGCRCVGCRAFYAAWQRDYRQRRRVERQANSLVDPDSAWMDRAACRDEDPNLFFPERGENTMPAKQICAECPVRETCLEYAMANHFTHGIWGGQSERQRRVLRASRRAA